MSTLLNNSYLAKVSTWGREEGGKIAQNLVNVVCTRSQIKSGSILDEKIDNSKKDSLAFFHRGSQVDLGDYGISIAVNVSDFFF